MHRHRCHYYRSSPTLRRVDIAFKALACLIAIGFLLSRAYGQTISFSPQTVIGKRQPMQLWAVSGSVPENSRPPSAAIVYRIAAQHGLAWITPAVANARLNARDRKSLLSRLYRIGIYGVVGGKAMGDMRVIAFSSQVTAGLSVAVGLATVLLPLVQHDLPAMDPALIPTASPLMDFQGAVNWLLWTEPSAAGPFTEALP